MDRLADELVQVGVQEGERVVVWLPNQWRTPLYLELRGEVERRSARVLPAELLRISANVPGRFG